MTAAVIHLQKKEEAKFTCSACGADRGCQCNAPAIPKVQQAIEALKANPVKSDRAIAADIDVAPNTVKTARDELRSTAQLEDSPRIGLDGKARKLPEKKSEPEEEDDDVIDWPKEWAAARERAHKLEKRNSELSAALNAKEAEASRNWPADMTPKQVKKRDQLLKYISWNQRDLEQLYGEVTGRPSWRVEVTTKDGTRKGTGARFGTRGEAEKYNADFAPGQLEDYATGEIIPCEEIANVLIEGDSLRFSNGDCVLLEWRSLGRADTGRAVH